MDEISRRLPDIEDYEETALSLSDYYLIWQRRKWWAICAFAVSIVVSLMLCFLLPKVYMATTTILVTPKVISDEYFKDTITMRSDKYLNVLTQEIMSTSRLQKTIEKFGLFREKLGKVPMQAILEGMRENIGIEVQKPERGSSQDISYFILSYTGSEPVTVKNVANYLAESFIEDMLNVRLKQARETTQFLSIELAKAQTALQEQEQQISKFKEKYLGLLPEQQNMNLQMITQLLQQKERINADIKDAENRRIILLQQNNQLVTVGILANSPQMLGTAAASSPQQELQLAKRQYLEKRSYMTEAHPDMLALKKKISTLEQKLQTGAVTESTAPDKNAVSSSGKSFLSADIEAQLSSVNRKIDELKEALKKNDSQIALYQERIDKAPQVEYDLSIITHDYENAKDIANTLRKKQLDANQISMLETQNKQDYFKVLEPATVPEKPEFPKKRKMLLFGFLIGVGLAIGSMILMEFLDNSFHTAKQVEHYLGVPVLTSIADHKFAAASEPPKARSFS
jgi:polysaccharide biosynthesis transport protein